MKNGNDASYEVEVFQEKKDGNKTSRTNDGTSTRLLVRTTKQCWI